jgi:Tfp pilus assembly protein PilW
MSDRRSSHSSVTLRAEAGYTLIEALVAVAVLMIVSGTVFSGVTQLANVNRSLHNRSEMHAGIRNATELLQQEIGQAGRIALPGAVSLTGAVAVGAATVGVTSAAGMFVGEQLTVGTGANQETVALTGVNAGANTITAPFAMAHAAGTPVSVQGGFSSGVVPTTVPNGSSGTVLKIFGDIRGDGSLMYVEYTCDTNAGNLYRNAMAYNAAQKPPVAAVHVLVSSLLPNPGGTPCFFYRQQTVGNTTFVVQVATTLTVQTANRDPITDAFQTDTNAVVHVTPRNVLYVWQLAGLGHSDRVQPTPPSVQQLLP